MIQLQDIQVIYNQGKANEVHALHNVNLDIKRGDFVSIVGPSGSGKSTLLYVIGGLLKPQQGSCIVDGNNLMTMNGRKLAAFRNSNVGFVLQDFGLLRNATVMDNVLTPLLFSKDKFFRMEKRAIDALKMLQIEKLAQRKVHQLSGGQCQRVAIARAIITNPSVLLADEPTGALDSDTAQQLMDVLQFLNQQGKTILMVTHNTNLCKWCSRTISITDGMIRQ